MTVGIWDSTNDFLPTDVLSAVENICRFIAGSNLWNNTTWIWLRFSFRLTMEKSRACKKGRKRWHQHNNNKLFTPMFFFSNLGYPLSFSFLNIIWRMIESYVYTIDETWWHPEAFNWRELRIENYRLSAILFPRKNQNMDNSAVMKTVTKRMTTMGIKNEDLQLLYVYTHLCPL